MNILPFPLWLRVIPTRDSDNSYRFAFSRVVPVLVWLILPAVVSAQSGQSVTAPISPQAKKGSRQFAPGIRIDWDNMRVEVDARVVLRDGALELVACSPRTREHESIVAVDARPLNIFQALGLIGLEPGSPAKYVERTQTWSPPRGEALRILVRYEKDGKTLVHPVESWLQEVKTKKPPKKIDWVFSGSQIGDSKRFAADAEGTVVCVVDFESALVSVGQLHSADNELLWLTANTDAIPPIGTKCTLIIQGAGSDGHASDTIYLDLGSVGVLRHDGKPVGPRAVRGWIESGKKVVIRASSSLPTESLNHGLRTLDRAGIARTSYKVLTVD